MHTILHRSELFVGLLYQDQGDEAVCALALGRDGKAPDIARMKDWVSPPV